VTWLLAGIALQIPDVNDYDNAWKYLVAVLLFLGVPVVAYLFKENAKLTSQIQTETAKQRDDWKLRSETCSADFGKTSEALKVANDTTVIIVGKVDRISEGQTRLIDKFDRREEKFADITQRLDRIQVTLDRPPARGEA
jgi:hypothetical protein